MDITCSICLSKIPNKKTCTTNCNHKFCNDCLNKWFNKKKISCPICRSNIKTYKYNNETNRIIFIDSNENIPQRNIIRRSTNNIIINKKIFIIFQMSCVSSILFICSNIYFVVKYF